MKLKVFFILILNLLLISCSKEERDMHKRNKIEQKLLLKTTNQLESEKQLKFTGYGGSSDKGLTMLSLSFEADKNYDIQTGRKLIVYCAEKFLENINSDEKIRPYLKSYPFHSKDIQLFISINNKSKISDENHLESIILGKGSIDYLIYDENHRLKTVREETYEEALNIIQKQKKEKNEI
ncbi:MAG: hypothetical protein WCT85_05535 [Parachlamydiales bacterium]|jgi:hypothetical protein